MSLKDNLKRWREAAEIDWFSQFIKAWIPFNAWMTDTYGDLTDRELLDHVKGSGNVVFNRVVPMLSQRLPQARDTQRGGWQDDSPEALDFRFQISELHRVLQSCVVDSRRGRVSFETVDIGSNPTKDQQKTKWKRNFRVRRDYPNKPEVTLEISASATSGAFLLTLPNHNRRLLEDTPIFQYLTAEQRDTIIALFSSVGPRRVVSVIAAHGATETLKYGGFEFVPDPVKVFAALVEVIYNLRNALFHGAITPNETHNEIYKPAYQVVMRLVRCTI